MIRTLKYMTTAVLVGGSIATIYFSGEWRNFPKFSAIGFSFLLCYPFLMLAWASSIGRHPGSLLVTLAASLFASLWGNAAYYDAFWRRHHDEMAALALFYVPLFQGVLATAALLVAFIQNKVCAPKAAS